nr:hypothetical protein [Synechococcus sp. AH-551-C10]
MRLAKDIDCVVGFDCTPCPGDKTHTPKGDSVSIAKQPDTCPAVLTPSTSVDD